LQQRLQRFIGGRCRFDEDRPALGALVSARANAASKVLVASGCSSGVLLSAGTMPSSQQLQQLRLI